MKNIYKHIVLIAAALTCSTALMAQMQPGTGPDGVVFNKTTEEINPNNYEITIDAFVTGTTQTSNEVQPCDIVLVFDLSSSMSKDVTVDSETLTKVSTGTQIKPGTLYKVTIDGKQYYLKGFKESSYALDSKHTTNPQQYKNGFNQTRYRWYFTFTFKYSFYYAESQDDLSNLATAKSKATLWKQVTTSVDTTVDGQKSNTPQPTPSEPTDPNAGYKITASEEVYSIQTTSKEMSRLDALKLAAKQFVATVYANNPTVTPGTQAQYHKIALVGFNEVGKTLQGFTDVTSATTLSTKISGVQTGDTGGSSMYTNPASGLYEASKLFDGVKNDGRSKVVVFFTDGNPCPSGTNNFSNAYGSTAVNMSYVLKQDTGNSFSYKYTDPRNSSISKTFTSGYGAKVYSIAVLDSENNYIRRFLHFVSSNYPDKLLDSNYSFPNNTSGEGGEAMHDYYQLSDGSNLTAIFEKIARESAQPSYSLTEESTATVDIISDYFVLPESTPNGTYTGAEEGKAIKLFVAKATGKSGDSYTFDEANKQVAKTAKDEDNQSICPNINAVVSTGADGNKIITIKNFDYAKYCVRESGESYKGYKLIIKISIEINPDNPGGANVPSNAAGSGIYHDGKQVAEFQQPNVHIPNIVIIKQGLKKGESATFTVTGKDEDNKDLTPITLVATCKADGKDAVARVKIQKPGRYTVTESTWSWAYSVSELVSSYTKDDSGTTTNATNRSITRNVNEDTEDSTYSGTPFIFKNSAKSGMPDHGESYKPNVFTIQQ